MSSKYFTPIVIIVELCIAVGGVVVLQVIDRMFRGDKYINIIRMGCIAFGLCLMTFAFNILSFRNVKLSQGPQGPQGNRGLRGFTGADGTLRVCGDHVLTVEDVRNKTRAAENLDLQNPYIIQD
jgi:hypothetical protein